MAITNVTEALDALKDLAERLPTLDGHTQAADTITGGTFAGEVAAHASFQSPSASLLRNSKLSTTEVNPSSNGEIVWQYG